MDVLLSIVIIFSCMFAIMAAFFIGLITLIILRVCYIDLRRWFNKRRKAKAPDDGLHVCLACGKDFVNPVDWEPASPETWWMRLRCGECHVWREVTVTNQVAERLNIELNRRVDLIDQALAKLDREQMAREVETMIGALRHGLIEPADFARRF